MVFSRLSARTKRRTASFARHSPIAPSKQVAIELLPAAAEALSKNGLPAHPTGAYQSRYRCVCRRPHQGSAGHQFRSEGERLPSRVLDGVETFVTEHPGPDPGALPLEAPRRRHQEGGVPLDSACAARADISIGLFGRARDGDGADQIVEALREHGRRKREPSVCSAYVDACFDAVAPLRGEVRVRYYEGIVDVLLLEVWCLVGSPRRRKPGAPARLLHIADANLAKDQKTLLGAASLLLRRNVDFTLDVVGTDTLGGRMQRRAAEIGLGERMRFRGFLPHGDLRAVVEATSWE